MPPDDFTQDDRLIAITTKLGANALLLDNFSASEAISGLFVIEASLLTPLARSAQVVGKDLIGTDATVRVALSEGRKRFFNGVISRFAASGHDERFAYYHCQIVPWFWLLTLTAGCRAFQGKSVTTILQEIVDKRKLGEMQVALRPADYTVRDYCVQYRETDFNFMSRVMEEEGIFYFFSHQTDARTARPAAVLVTADALEQLTPCPGQPQASFLPDAPSTGAQDRIITWEERHELRPGKVTLRDYHFENPDVIEEVTKSGTPETGGDQKFEIYDYPGDYAEKFNKTGERLDKVHAEGERNVAVRLGEELAPFAVFSGTSTCAAFLPGFTFALQNHSSRMDGNYVLTSVQHSATQSPAYVSGQPVGTPYTNRFSCIKPTAAFKPARVTPKPVVQGLHTAEVSGPKDPASGRYKEDIWPDAYGRVKVIFHWDRDYKSNVAGEGKDDAENSSCWVRVAQVWAGKGFGAIFTPRCGDEVVVAFLEGDPDRPVIVGSLYNKSHQPPYKLPDHKTRSGFMTRSSKEGTADNFNEIYFEDEKGKEVLHVHAERTLSTVVEASESRSVGGSRSTTIGQDETLTIKKGDRTETLEEGSDTLTIKMGDHTETLDKGTYSLAASMGDVKFSAPAGKFSASAKEIEISGTTKVKISCGASTIEMSPADIKISSPTIEINGTGTATLKGAMVKINC